MAYQNLLTVMYPVGSLYFSTTPTSPASIIGGTWSQVVGAMIAATGDNNVAGAASYGGNLVMTEAQMPEHYHYPWADEAGDNYCFTLNRDWTTDSIARVGVASGSTYTVMGANRSASDYGGISDISQSSYTKPAGESQQFLPYHFGTYVWYRTA